MCYVECMKILENMRLTVVDLNLKFRFAEYDDNDEARKKMLKDLALLSLHILYILYLSVYLYYIKSKIHYHTTSIPHGKEITT